MLQKMLGSCYDVQNFGDCCATVLRGYPTQPETHPYLDPPARFAPAFHESVSYAPDVVVIGSWGKHDTEIQSVLDAGKLDPVQWQADYEQLVTTYLNLPSKPIVYVSTPLPLPKGAGTGPVTDVMLPAIQNIATKYHLPIVPLYPAFLNQPQLYKDDTHPTDTTGLQTIADAVYVTMTATLGSCGDGGLVPPPADGGAWAEGGATGDGDAGADAGSGAGGGRDGADSGTGSAARDGGTATGNGAGSDGGTPAKGCACSVAGDSQGSLAMGLLGAAVGCLRVRRRRRRGVSFLSSTAASSLWCQLRLSGNASGGAGARGSPRIGLLSWWVLLPWGC
jgi:MYXO-CTERM domain-containing protein